MYYVLSIRYAVNIKKGWTYRNRSLQLYLYFIVLLKSFGNLKEDVLVIQVEKKCIYGKFSRFSLHGFCSPIVKSFIRLFGNKDCLTGTMLVWNRQSDGVYIFLDKEFSLTFCHSILFWLQNRRSSNFVRNKLNLTTRFHFEQRYFFVKNWMLMSFSCQIFPWGYCFEKLTVKSRTKQISSHWNFIVSAVPDANYHKIFSLFVHCSLCMAQGTLDQFHS